MMPKETKQAIEWAITQSIVDEFGEEIQVKNNNHLIVDFTRKYFNENNIEYYSFSYEDLEPFLN